MAKIAVTVGTRPEAIKLAPVIQELDRQSDLQAVVCNTGQHEQLCGQTLAYFGITAPVKLNVMREGQSLAALQGRVLSELSEFLEQVKPDAVVVQGDTMSAFCGALAGFYRRLPVFHVEAGLRSHDLGEPFPEEALRQMLARITNLHFAPTEAAKTALLAEGIDSDKIHVTGNTVIDALASVTPEALSQAERQLDALVNGGGRLVLVTVHRRENHGARLDSILAALLALGEQFPDCRYVLPVHPNPHVRGIVRQTLAGRKNMVLTEPLSYPQLICMMQHASLILTDSGGIQEEAPSFGVPVLVLRYETERKEGIGQGCARLVGAHTGHIVAEAGAVLACSEQKRHEPCINPYGDGKAAKRIVRQIRKYVGV